MYQLSVLQNQWLILALFGGAVLMLFVVAAYLMMWRPRSLSPQPIAGLRQLAGWIPWFIVVLFIFIIIYQLTYTIILHYYPANI